MKVNATFLFYFSFKCFAFFFFIKSHAEVRILLLISVQMKHMDLRYAGMEKGGRYLLYSRNDSEDTQVTLSILSAVFLTSIWTHTHLSTQAHFSKSIAEFRAILCEIYAAPLLSYTLPHSHI